MTYESDSGERKIFKNGELQYVANLPAYQSDLNDGVLVGGIKYWHYSSPQIGTAGYIDDVGVWSRPLMEGEVVALYESLALATPGCMEEAACNYTPEATFSDGSCDLISCHCLEGTAWDESLGGCIPLISAETACGEGTVWDTEAQNCVIVTPSDTDFDGCVGMTDLLDLLSLFGTCGEEELEEEPEVAEWSCGSPLAYQGYDYETVLIGEQCWFAENLRCEEYGNGDPIPANLSDAEWTSTHSGAKSIYGEENATCQASYSPEGDACNDNWSLAEFGYLYNWYAATDPRGLCPSGWHLPSDNEWTLVTNHLGGDTVAGGHLKSTSGWNEEGVGGSNSSGFSGLPGGHRYYSNGNLNHAGNRGFWWSSSWVGSVAWLRRLDHDSGAVVRYNNSHRDGHSVRCIKDSE